MTLLHSIKRRIGRPLKQYARRFTAGSRLASTLSPYLPSTVCVEPLKLS